MMINYKHDNVVCSISTLEPPTILADYSEVYCYRDRDIINILASYYNYRLIRNNLVNLRDRVILDDRL